MPEEARRKLSELTATWPQYGAVRIELYRQGQQAIARVYSVATGQFIRELDFPIDYLPKRA